MSNFYLRLALHTLTGTIALTAMLLVVVAVAAGIATVTPGHTPLRAMAGAAVPDRGITDECVDSTAWLRAI